MRDELVGFPRGHSLVIENHLINVEDLMNGCELIDFLEDSDE